MLDGRPEAMFAELDYQSIGNWKLTIEISPNSTRSGRHVDITARHPGRSPDAKCVYPPKETSVRRMCFLVLHTSTASLHRLVGRRLTLA